MKNFALAIILACALSGTTFAGIIHSTDEPAPGEIHSTGDPSPGDVPSTGESSPGDVPGVDLSVVLTMLDLMF